MWSPIAVRSSVNGYSGSLHVTNALPLASVAEEAFKLCVVFDYVSTPSLLKHDERRAL